MRGYAESILKLAVKGTDDSKTCLLGTGGNTPLWLGLNVEHRTQQPQVVQIVIGGLVDSTLFIYLVAKMGKIIQITK